MSSSSSSGSTRVHEILQRMQENSGHVDSLKTCCGVLAILSRDEANKLLIARDGIRLLTTVMNTHISNSGLQEAACDLIWSMAFNNNLVKEVIGRQGGIPVIIKGMRLHAGSADLLKSACGALSNMCQNPHNQSLIAAHGGVNCIVDSLRRHKTNAAILPFIFDALASLIVGNDRNAKEVSEAGSIDLILESIQLHSRRAELVKSGCHALAILSDSQGQGSKISAADGVKVLLPTLRAHPNYLDLHRVAAVVLLRMLQESPVARDIAESGGVPLMLLVLKEQQHEVETVAAACHILYSISHPDAVGNPNNPVDIEAQLMQPTDFDTQASTTAGSDGAPTRGAASPQLGATSDPNSSSSPSSSSSSSAAASSSSVPPLAAGGQASQSAKRSSPVQGVAPPPPQIPSVVHNLSALTAVIRRHSQRKDIVRACVRSLVNLSKFRSLLAWIDGSETVGAMLAAASSHAQARDITDSCATLVKAVHRRVPTRPGARLNVHLNVAPTQGAQSEIERSVSGLLSCLKARPNDVEMVGSVFATLTNALVALGKSQGKGGKGSSAESHDFSDLSSSSAGSTAGVHDKALSSRRLAPSSVAPTSSATTGIPSVSDWEKDAARVTLVWASMLARELPSSGRASMASVGAKSDDANAIMVSSTKSGSGSSNASVAQLFWTKERSLCVFYMARFLKTIVQIRSGPSSSSSIGTSMSRVKSGSSFRAAMTSPLNGFGGVGSVLDVSAAKDVISNLFDSLPDSMQSFMAPSSSIMKAGADGSSASGEDWAAQLWKELETLLNCLVTALQEIEMDEASAAAAHYAQLKVAKDYSGKPPPSVTAAESLKASILLHEAESGIHASTEVDKKGTALSAHYASGEKGGSDGLPNKSKSSGSAASAASSDGPSRSSAEKQPHHTAGQGMAQWVKGVRECTCFHGDASIALTKRHIPIHPLHDPSINIKMMPQSSPAELEMIHVARPTQIGEDGLPLPSFEEPTGIPTKMMLCYDGCSAAGLGVQSKESIRFPYDLPPKGTPQDTFPHTLSFDACFESGNLQRAIQRGPAEYDLFIRPDLHSAVGHAQWFYFAIGNTHPPSLVKAHAQNPNQPCLSRVKFNIVNLIKNDSLFNQGMRPIMFSVQDSQSATNPKGWVRAGAPGTISYLVNSFQRTFDGTTPTNYFTLSFSIDFHNPKDTYLVAHSYPYTYSDYKYHLTSLLSSPRTSRHMRRKVLCKSLGGHDCDLITIADFASQENKETGQFGVEEADLISQAVHKRKCIVLSSRVHPGEVGASWMMKGIMDFLTSENEQAALLRSIFVFKIVPMLNPDGVVFGNNRVSLSGVDLNRTWKRPVKAEHPTIWHWKATIRDLRNVYDVAMFVDLHGHSRKMNTFMYGCDDKRKPKPTVRVFPKLLSWNQYGKKYVSFADCCFAVKKGREGTGRVVVSKELGIQNAYTLEATFCGADFGPLKDAHFNIAHLCESGRALIDTLLDYYMPNPAQREKAANLLKQASERKSARDRSERMAEARRAMQQSIRADESVLTETDLSKCNVDGEVLNALEVAMENNNVDEDSDVASDAGSEDEGGAGVGRDRSGSDVRAGSKGGGGRGELDFSVKGSAASKLNSFMIENESKKKDPIPSNNGGSLVVNSSNGNSLYGSSSSSNSNSSRQGSAGQSAPVMLGSVSSGFSGSLGSAGSSVRPFGGFEKDRGNTSAKRGGVSVINGFMNPNSSSSDLTGPSSSATSGFKSGSVGGISGSSPRSQYSSEGRTGSVGGGGGGESGNNVGSSDSRSRISSSPRIFGGGTRKDSSDSLSILPGSLRTARAASIGSAGGNVVGNNGSFSQLVTTNSTATTSTTSAATAASQSWLLATLTRDSNTQIGNERINLQSARNCSPGPPVPVGSIGMALPNPLSLPSSASSLSDLTGSASPANRNRNLISAKSSNSISGAGGGAGTSSSGGSVGGAGSMGGQSGTSGIGARSSSVMGSGDFGSSFSSVGDRSAAGGGRSNSLRNRNYDIDTLLPRVND